MELYWKIRSSLYPNLLRYNLILRHIRLTGSNYTELQVLAAVMIRTCMGVGSYYYEFQMLLRDLLARAWWVSAGQGSDGGRHSRHPCTG